MTEPRCRGSPAVVSMIMARRGTAKNNNHIRQEGIKKLSSNISRKHERSVRQSEGLPPISSGGLIKVFILSDV